MVKNHGELYETGMFRHSPTIMPCLILSVLLLAGRHFFLPIFCTKGKMLTIGVRGHLVH